MAAKKKDQTTDKTAAKAKGQGKAVTVIMPHVNSQALQVTTGPKILAMLAESEKLYAKANALGVKASEGRNRVLGQTVDAIMKIAKLDTDNIVLENRLADDQVVRERLYDSINIALGVKAISKEDPTKLVYTEAVRESFPPARPKKGHAETAKGIAQRNVQMKWQDLIRRGTEAALGMTVAGVDVVFDNAGKTLKVTNAPKQIAGPAKEILLDGKTKEGATERASIESFARLAREEYGVAPPKGKLTDVQNLAQNALASEDTFGQVCNAFITVVNKLMDTPLSEGQLTSINAVYNKCEEVLKAQLAKAKALKEKASV
jgi:hypothetical protein